MQDKKTPKKRGKLDRTERPPRRMREPKYFLTWNPAVTPLFYHSRFYRFTFCFIGTNICLENLRELDDASEQTREFTWIKVVLPASTLFAEMS